MTCPCGGIIRKYDLVGNREVWKCGGCGRHEIHQLKEPTK
jgi:hypothetical protein